MLLFLLFTGTAMANKIRCYQCTAPRITKNWANYCTQDLFCRGSYCTKGPDDKSNGIFYGCANTPPLDRNGNQCKVVQNVKRSNEMYENCFCKNVDFCNASQGILNLAILVIFIYYIYLLYYV